MPGALESRVATVLSSNETRDGYQLDAEQIHVLAPADFVEEYTRVLMYGDTVNRSLMHRVVGLGVFTTEYVYPRDLDQEWEMRQRGYEMRAELGYEEEAPVYPVVKGRLSRKEAEDRIARITESTAVVERYEAASRLRRVGLFIGSLAGKRTYPLISDRYNVFPDVIHNVSIEPHQVFIYEPEIQYLRELLGADLPAEA